MTRSEIERMVAAICKQHSLPISDEQMKRVADEVEEDVRHQEAGVIDLNSERELREEAKFLARVAAEFPGCDLSTLRWAGDHWEIG